MTFIAAKNFGLNKSGDEIFLLRSSENSEDMAIVAQEKNGFICLACLCMNNCTTRMEQHDALKVVVGDIKRFHYHQLPVKDGEIEKFLEAEKQRVQKPLSDYFLRQQQLEQAEKLVREHEQKLEALKWALVDEQNKLTTALNEAKVARAAVGTKPEIKITWLKDLQ